MLSCSSCGSAPGSGGGCTLCSSWRYPVGAGIERFFGPAPKVELPSGDLVIKREGRDIIDDGHFPYCTRGDWTCPLCGGRGLTLGEVGLHIVTHAHESRYTDWYRTTSDRPRNVPEPPPHDSPYKDLPLLRLIQ